jgi:hypothetical protein
MGSFSDGCSAVIITYFTEIYNFLQENFKSGDVCHVAGVCSAVFHTHRVSLIGSCVLILCLCCKLTALLDLIEIDIVT